VSVVKLTDVLTARIGEAGEGDFWFMRPPGFIPIDLGMDIHEIDEAYRRVTAGKPPAERLAFARPLVSMLTILAKLIEAKVRYFALGVHPDENGGESIATLGITIHAVDDLNANFALARIASLMKSWGKDIETVEIALPGGPGIVASAVSEFTNLDVPEAARERIWQTRIMVPFPDGSRILALEITTVFPEQAQNYRDILIGVARTITFEPPTKASDPIVDGRPSISDVLRGIG
jgi:hypothetical protein